MIAAASSTFSILFLELGRNVAKNSTDVDKIVATANYYLSVIGVPSLVLADSARIRIALCAVDKT